MNLKKFIREINDFPKKGVAFKDISPLLANTKVFNYVIKKFAKETKDADLIVAADARGFLFASPIAILTKKPFVMIRKPNKLPYKTINQKYVLEYQENELQIHVDSIKKGQKVIVIDDVLATGATTEAIIKLVKKLGGKIIKLMFLIDLQFLTHRKIIDDYPIVSLIKYQQ